MDYQVQAVILLPAAPNTNSHSKVEEGKPVNTVLVHVSLQHTLPVHFILVVIFSFTVFGTARRACLHTILKPTFSARWPRIRCKQ